MSDRPKPTCPACGSAHFWIRKDRELPGNRGTIRTYTCPDCGKEVLKLFDGKTETDYEEEDFPRGLACPDCGGRHFAVLYTRATLGDRIMRRRQCHNCGRRVSTTEKIT